MYNKTYCGPVIACALHNTLSHHSDSYGTLGGSWRWLPDGTKVYIGTEHYYTQQKELPEPTPVNLGGIEPYVLFARGQHDKNHAALAHYANLSLRSETGGEGTSLGSALVNLVDTVLENPNMFKYGYDGPHKFGERKLATTKNKVRC